MSQDIFPRSFKRWYGLLKFLCHTEELTMTQIIVISQILTTVFNLVNEIKLLYSEKNKETLELIDLLKGSVKFSKISDFTSENLIIDPSIHEGVDDLKETVMLLKYYISNPNVEPPKWARQVVTSLRLTLLSSGLYQYDNIRPMMSLASTCSTMEYSGKTITIPGVFASCIEPDYLGLTILIVISILSLDSNKNTR